MTKSDRIRKLLAKGLSTTAIAERVGCRMPYIRAVRQRTDVQTGKAVPSSADMTYGRTMTHENKHAHYAAMRARHRVLYATRDRDAVKRAARSAWSEARRAGATSKDARRIAARAARQAEQRTGDKDSANRAAREARAAYWEGLRNAAA